MDYLKVLVCCVFLACVSAGPSPMSYSSGVFCKGRTAQVKCPENLQLTITSLTFGTGPEGDEVCGNNTSTSPVCTVAGALEKAKTSCDGKENCDVVASGEVFGESCSGANVYMKLDYQCQYQKQVATACEGAAVTVECPAGFAIGIFNYTYGRTSLDVCPKDGETNTDCFAEKGPHRGVEMCAGRQYCQLEATNYAHGDPCSDTSKYLQVDYFCHECTNAHGNDTECSLWASQNQCQSNSGWMMQNCGKACTQCDKVTCQNTHESEKQCIAWAKAGQCEANPRFMKAQCFKACSQCDLGDSCTNKREDADCDYWGGDDECSKSPMWMTDKCRKSCRQCPKINADERVAGFTNPTSALPALEYWASVCAGNTGVLECEDGYYIKMLAGSYGRTDAETCPSASLNFSASDACNKDSDAVLTDMQVICENQQSCSVEASRKYFPSACSDDLEMYLNVHFLCAQPIYKSSGCEGTTSKMECPKDTKISVLSTFYGRANNDICPRDDITDFNCSSAVAASQMDKICGNLNECTVDVVNDLFGDVCPNTPKYMEAEYICTDCKNVREDSKCKEWADWGECENNKAWMLANCRGSCAPCKRDAFMNRHTDDQQCTSWAAGVECTSNAGFMDQKCAGACNKDFAEHMQPQAEIDTSYYGAEDNTYLAEIPVEVCETAEDDKDECQSWGIRGECASNPVWMLENCNASCHHCSGCKNTYNYGRGDRECDKWAMQGECKNNPNWMAINCNASCSPCLKEEDLCVNIHNNDDCQLWASNGDCHTNPTVLRDCPRSCGVCGGKWPRNDTLDPAAATSCENIHNDTMCEVYKSRDLCVRGNREWMLVNCKKTCGVCDQPRVPKNYHAIVWELACESTTMKLQCYYGSHINIMHAFYGRDRDNLTCDSGYGDLDATCYSFTSTAERVKNICNGRESCNIGAESSVFGDPCPLISKYLEVTYECTEDPSKEQTRDVMVTDKAFLDIEIGGEPAGRIVIGLFRNTAPFAVKNFVEIIKGYQQRDGILWYRGSTFHRIIKGFTIQGGDFINGDGTGFNSIYGGNWPDTKFDLKHYGPGWVGMANAGRNTNGMQFYIIMQRADWLDGKHIIFGKVLEGMETARKMEDNPVGAGDKPIKDVVIADCGVLPVDEPFAVSKESSKD